FVLLTPDSWLLPHVRIPFLHLALPLLLVFAGPYGPADAVSALHAWHRLVVAESDCDDHRAVLRVLQPVQYEPSGTRSADSRRARVLGIRQRVGAAGSPVPVSRRGLHPPIPRADGDLSLAHR